VRVKSEHGERFNHDEDADGYDQNVRNEVDPIRAGYAALLSWVAASVSGGQVLDLGTGTGNLTVKLPEASSVVCVDLSSRMLERAALKLKERDVSFVQVDLIGATETHPGPYDAIVSTYAIHHLTDDEKDVLLGRLAVALKPGGVMAFGDLMFSDAAGRATIEEKYADRPALIADFDDEFFWDVGRAVKRLESLGFSVEAKRFSDLSWGIRALRRR